LSTAEASGFGIVRSLQQMGASLNCTSSRENLVFSLRVPQERWVSKALSYVDATITQCHYYHWELPRVVYKQLHIDQEMYKRRQFDLKLSELLHTAAYRGQDLSHSLIAPEHALLRYREQDEFHPKIIPPPCDQECYSEETIIGFVKRRIHQQPATIVVSGISHPFAQELQEKVNSGKLFSALSGTDSSSAGTKTSPVKFYPGDQRHEIPVIDMGMVALAWPTSGMGHPDQVALSVLLRGLTGGTLGHPRIRWGSLADGILWDALQGETNLPPMAVGGLHWAYADQGLFGIQLNGINKNGGLGTALRVVARHLKQVAKDGLTEKDLNRAKAMYRMDLLLELETSNSAAAHIGDELSATGSISKIDDTLNAVEKLTVNNIKRVAGQVFGRLPALAAVGDINGVPYADELSRSS
jgi:ubiquinol-cytochrome c reductase core subunit 2